MSSQRILLGLVLGLAAGAAAAQSGGTLRWHSGAALGLQPSEADLNLPCGPVSLACRSAIVPLYVNPVRNRSVSVQFGAVDTPAPGFSEQGPTFNIVGRAGLLPDVGVYGRFGTTIARTNTLGAGPSTAGINYGVGLSWDFTRRASATLGYDSYDVRGMTGELRDVHATSLGLRWRY